MKTGSTALQLARILVLLFLLRATGWYVDGVSQASAPIQMDEYRGQWAGVSFVTVLFVVVMLVGRRRWHPWPVLGVEGIVAAVLAFVPPLQWVIWFQHTGWTITMVGGWVQPLAVAWLAIVVLRGFHQLRDADTAAPRRSEGGAKASDVSDTNGRVSST